MTNNHTRKGPLAPLLEAAPKSMLIDLIDRVAATNPAIRRICLEHLNTQGVLSQEQEQQSEGERVIALWLQLFPDLEELAEYDDHDSSLTRRITSLLDEIEQALSEKNIHSSYRQDLRDRVLQYIEGGVSEVEDSLYWLAYATCHTTDEWRRLAHGFEALGEYSSNRHARDIYRRIGDQQRFIELRRRDLTFGTDYHDLAVFQWNLEQRQEAIEVAEEGLQKASGRMIELREFLAQRAKSDGNRERYLALSFENTLDGLTYETYKAFQEICTRDEWEAYQGKILARLQTAQTREQLRIRMHREEYEEAKNILCEHAYPRGAWSGGYLVETAEQLEGRYPLEILRYYISGLGNMKNAAERKKYAHKAQLMGKIHRVMVDVLGDAPGWRDFALEIKQANIMRPAFQEEFAKFVPGWWSLK